MILFDIVYHPAAAAAVEVIMLMMVHIQG